MASVARKLFVTSLTFIALVSCGNPQTKALSSREQSAGSSSQISYSAASGVTVNGTTITADKLSATALEAAGAVAVEEHALMVLLDAELKSAGLSVSAKEIESERRLLIERISADAQVPVDQAAALIERFRAARGLGPQRFTALLERTAKLRSLVQSNNIINEHEVLAAAKRDTGPRTKARIIVVTTASQAAAIRNELTSLSGPAQAVRFAQLAYEQSRDPSSARGGLFGPVPHGDTTLPAPIRDSLTLSAGTISDVLAIDSGFAILRIEEQLPATNADQTTSIAAARIRLERQAIEKLSAELMSRARIMVQDQSARWAWENRPR